MFAFSLYMIRLWIVKAFFGDTLEITEKASYEVTKNQVIPVVKGYNLPKKRKQFKMRLTKQAVLRYDLI